MPGTVSCIFTKALIPFVEREVGPEGVAAVLALAGRPREWLISEYNQIPLELADRLARLSMELMAETDEDRWGRRYGEDFMDWKPSREERAWGGAYTMSFGSPRAIYARTGTDQLPGFSEYHRGEILRMRRRRALFRFTPYDGVRLPRWSCTWLRVCFERYPTNWRLPRARVVEHSCAAHGDPACILEVHWRNPPLGARFWAPAAGGAAVTIGAAALWALPPAAPALATAGVVLPALLGAAVGYGMLKEHRRAEAQRLLRIQGEEILYSSRQLERKFRELEARLEQLSLLIDLSRAVNATLDPETIYDQALRRLVQAPMGYERAYLFLVDRERGVLRGHRMAGGDPALVREFAGYEVPLDPVASASARVAVTGQPLRVHDVERSETPLHLAAVRTFNVRSFVAVPLHVKGRVAGVLHVVSGAPDRFADADVELLAAVASHVALALDRADSFQTIEDLSRGLEEKVRLRTEQLGAANDELQAAYRNLQATQMQLLHREKMASVGQLVAGVAHELNNPIGFVFSNVATLEDFVGRLRAMLEAYRQRADRLPDAEREVLAGRWEALRIDYALKYLDAMTGGIREGAERARKIVRDLRVFARADADVWQPVDLHAELESSLTLLSHLLKDRVAVERKYGELPPVECIRSQVDQVFLNLLANAAQAIPGEGSIRIETCHEDGFAVVAIADTGAGIPPEVIGRVFDPFFTTKPVGEGSGLGLSISYEIVERHGGEIAATSAPGGGATFTVRIPVARVG